MSLDYTRPIRVKGTHEKVEILRTDLKSECSMLTKEETSQFIDAALDAAGGAP